MTPFYVSLKPFLDHRGASLPVDWAAIFGNSYPVEVEIGFGNGEYLAQLADQNLKINFVGFEEYCERIAKTLRKLSRVSHSQTRVLRLDVRPAFEYLFTERSISKIHCLYPPPWPKKSDAKHRLFTSAFFTLTNNRLVDGGTLKIVTDHRPYMEWLQENIPALGFKSELKTIQAAYGTKFERKWVEAGQSEFYELLLTKTAHLHSDSKKEILMKHYFLEQFNPSRFVMEPYSKDNVAVVFRGLLYDSARQTALVHVLVHDEHIMQHLRIIISHSPKGWRIGLAEGTMQMPTEGVSVALELVHQAALKSIQ